MSLNYQPHQQASQYQQQHSSAVAATAGVHDSTKNVLDQSPVNNHLPPPRSNQLSILSACTSLSISVTTPKVNKSKLNKDFAQKKSRSVKASKASAALGRPPVDVQVLSDEVRHEHIEETVIATSVMPPLLYTPEIETTSFSAAQSKTGR